MKVLFADIDTFVLKENNLCKHIQPSIQFDSNNKKIISFDWSPTLRFPHWNQSIVLI